MSGQKEDQQSRMKDPAEEDIQDAEEPQQANQPDEDDEEEDDDYKPDEEEEEEEDDDQQEKADDEQEEEAEQEQEPELEPEEQEQEEQEEEEEEPGLASLYGPDLQDDEQEPDYQEEAEPESEDIEDDADETKHQGSSSSALSSASKPEKRSHSEIYDSMSSGLGDPMLAGPEEAAAFPPLSVGDALNGSNLAGFDSFPPPFEENGQFELANPLAGDILPNPEEPAGDAEQPSSKRVKLGPESP